MERYNHYKVISGWFCIAASHERRVINIIGPYTFILFHCDGNFVDTRIILEPVPGIN